MGARKGRSLFVLNTLVQKVEDRTRNNIIDFGNSWQKTKNPRITKESLTKGILEP